MNGELFENDTNTLSRTYNISKEVLAQFLGISVDDISESFMVRFDTIRNEVIARIPSVVEQYYRDRKKSIGSTNRPYMDPKVAKISEVERVELRKFAEELGVTNTAKSIPGDVLIRAASMVRILAWNALDGKTSVASTFNPAEDKAIRATRSLIDGRINYANSGRKGFR